MTSVTSTVFGIESVSKKFLFASLFYDTKIFMNFSAVGFLDLLTQKELVLSIILKIVFAQ